MTVYSSSQNPRRTRFQCQTDARRTVVMFPSRSDCLFSTDSAGVFSVPRPKLGPGRLHSQCQQVFFGARAPETKTRRLASCERSRQPDTFPPGRPSRVAGKAPHKKKMITKLIALAAQYFFTKKNGNYGAATEEIKKFSRYHILNAVFFADIKILVLFLAITAFA